MLLAQSTVLFSATIEENITLFKDIPSDITLDAIDKAGLKKWFKDTGGNLKKSFEKSSINLSGGEQRRVDFARTSVEDADEKRGYIYNIIR